MSARTARRAARRRSAFTLLEVTAAVALSVVLVLSLYFALSMQSDVARDSREIVDENAIVRSILTRINSDLAAVQGPFNPYLNAANAYDQETSFATNTSASSSSSSGTGSSGSSGSGTGSSSGSGSGSSSSSSSSSSSNSSTATTSVPNVALTNIGVSGQQDSVVFTMSRLSKDVTDAIAGGEALPTPQCDIRRITYTVTDKGLVRQEDTNLFDSTFNIAGTSPTASTGETNETVVAPQVTKMDIKYYGPGGVVASTWSSVDFGPQVMSYANSTSYTQYYTQQGPPMAIEFTFTIKIPGSERGGEAREVQVRQIVAIATANAGSTQPGAQ